MPIGSSKLGVLGAGLVPGGSVTFNASGTWPIPPGVKKVSITGKGGTGNPGVAGNPGNPGNLGTGGSGGGGGRGACAEGGFGGYAFAGVGGNFVNNSPISNPAPNTSNLKRVLTGGTVNSPNAPGNPGQAGQAGQAGAAGNAGNPGNTGQCSSGLGNNFTGGAGGNAGVAGNAGAAGTGGNGGGSGSAGHNFQGRFGGAGGGGAGATNDGSSAFNSCNNNAPNQGPCVTTQIFGNRVGRGGNTANYSVATTNNNPVFGYTNNCPFPSNITGGMGGETHTRPNNSNSIITGSSNRSPATILNNCLPGGVRGVNPPAENQFPNSPAVTPYPLANPASQAVRSGGGGGMGGNGFNPGPTNNGGGGGGGAGRGNAGNAGGGSPTPTGTAATPATFNCVPVTPGTPTPITVGSPGGQIVISWNPQ
jgi:hypothetical protein